MVSRSLALVLLSPAATYGSYVSSPRLLRRSGSGGSSSLAFGAAAGHATSPSGRSAIQLATMSGAIVVTDGTDSFYGSRGIFQALYDGGEVDKIVAFSSSVSDAKKMCISRQARYSGLIEALDFAEGSDAELAETLRGAKTWVAMNADESKLLGQLEQAKGTGVERVFVHLSAASDAPSLDSAALTKALDACGISYTVMRTGSFGKPGSSAASGLILSEIDVPTCDEVPIDDAFRFLTEALTLPDASNRLFSLCPASDASQLKQMRMAGCTRREEVEALLKGQIKIKTPEELKAEAEATAAGKTAAEVAAEADDRPAEVIEAEREAEIKALMAKAKKEGIENAKRRAEEEARKVEERKERMQGREYQLDDDEKKDEDKKEEEEGDEGGKGSSDDGPKGSGDGAKGDGDGGKDDDDEGDGREPALL